MRLQVWPSRQGNPTGLDPCGKRMKCVMERSTGTCSETRICKIYLGCCFKFLDNIYIYSSYILIFLGMLRRSCRNPKARCKNLPQLSNVAGYRILGGGPGGLCCGTGIPSHGLPADFWKLVWGKEMKNTHSCQMFGFSLTK